MRLSILRGLSPLKCARIHTLCSLTHSVSGFHLFSKQYKYKRHGIVTRANKSALKMLGVRHLRAIVGERLSRIKLRDESGVGISLRAHELMDSVKLRSVYCTFEGYGKSHVSIPVHVGISGSSIQDGRVYTISITDLSELDETSRLAEARALFLANMSHEIRTPLNGILGMLTVLVDTTTVTAQQYQYLQSISRSGQSLLNLLNDVLVFTKSDADRIELESSPYSLLELVILFPRVALGFVHFPFKQKQKFVIV